MLKLNEQPLEPISHRESPCNCVYSLCHHFSEGLSKLLPVQMEKNGGENGALGGFGSMVLKIPSEQRGCHPANLPLPRLLHHFVLCSGILQPVFSSWFCDCCYNLRGKGISCGNMNE